MGIKRADEIKDGEITYGGKVYYHRTIAYANRVIIRTIDKDGTKRQYNYKPSAPIYVKE